MRLDQDIISQIHGDLYAENEDTFSDLPKKMSLLEFISKYGIPMPRRDSNYDPVEGKIIGYCQFKARNEGVYLQVLEKDLPPSFFEEND